MAEEQHDTGRRRAPDQPHGAPVAPPVDDEISLVDLLDALRRRWPVWVITTVLAAALAAVFLAARTPQFSYSATVRIGSLPLLDESVDEGQTDRAPVPIDSLDNVVVELERRYLPAARRTTGATTDVAAAQVEDADMVELTATAPAAARDAVTGVMEHALARLVADHRQALAGRLGQLRSREEALPGSSGGAAWQAKVDALERAIELLDGPLDGDVVETHARAENLLQSADPLLRPTRILALPSRSGSPTGVSPAVILVLALILGLGAGVVLALLVDAVARERQRAAAD